VTISREQVLDLVLPTLPTQVELDDPGELAYIDAGSIAAEVVELARAGRLGELTSFFAVVERLHAEGDDDVRNLATVGYLEGLQNLAGHRGLDPALFLPLLGPLSLRWWRGLNAFWDGGSAGGVLPVD
jgi:hypothetical protein